MSNRTIIEESEMISKNTRNIIEAAERKALLSLSNKEQYFDTRRDELNLMKELRKYRRSDDMKLKRNSPLSKRTANSI